MNQLPLLPNKYKKAGMILFFIGLTVGIFFFISNMEPGFLQYNFRKEPSSGDLFGGNLLFNSKGNFIDELIILALIIGGCLWGFSREKEEDEYLGQIRLNSLIWAFLINYLLVVLCTIFIYEFWYLDVMIFNLVIPLLIFLGRYNYLLNRIRRV